MWAVSFPGPIVLFWILIVIYSNTYHFRIICQEPLYRSSVAEEEGVDTMRDMARNHRNIIAIVSVLLLISMEALDKDEVYVATRRLP